MSFIGPSDLEMPMCKLDVAAGCQKKGLRIGSVGGILAGVVLR